MTPRRYRRSAALYWKLSAVLLAILVAVGSVTLLLTLRSAHLYFQEVHQRLNRDVAAHIAREVQPFSGARLNRAALEELFHDLMVINPTLEVYLLDGEGRILAYSAPPGKVRAERVDLGPLQRFLKGDGRMPIPGDDPRHPGRHKFFSAAPVLVDGSLRGYLYAILGGEWYDSTLQLLRMSYVLRMSAWLLGASLLAATLAGLSAFALLTRRLRRLRDVMEAFEHGDLQARAAVGPEDEIGALAEAYNRLAARIVEQMENLRNADLSRRELVANISHDLRTPAASLQGHLETLLVRQDRMQPEERQSSIEIGLRNAERLSRLLGELFELATLDARDAVVRLEPFSLADLAQDVMQKFQPQAERAGVTLRTEVPSFLPLVLGDIGLIERALDNLLDNALRYTPPGGRVTTVLSQHGHSVEVRVQDSGCGIPAEELPHVFERFYRGQRTRTSDARGTGLGLAITKRILDLHHTPIEVESSLDRGTSFRFSLEQSEPGASVRGLRLTSAMAEH